MSLPLPSDTPEREAFWSGVAAASFIYFLAFCVAASFRAFAEVCNG